MSDLETIQVPKRAYQACNRCRKRKARCILAEPALGGAIFCLRCKRERKECTFTVDRSEKTPRQRLRQSVNSQATIPNVDPPATVVPGTGAPLWSRTDSVGRQGSIGQANPAVGHLPVESPLSDLTERITHTMVSNQTDALNLLFEAAEVYHTNDASGRQDADDSGAAHTIPDAISANAGNFESPGNTGRWAVPAYPVSQCSQETVDIFSRLKCVKKWWLTAQEAAMYVDL